MNCLQFQERLQALLDNRQDIADDRAIRQHMAACPDCELLATAYTAVVRVPLRIADEHSLEATSSAALTDRIMADVSTPATRRPVAARPNYMVWMQWTAAVAACLLVAVGIYRQQGQASADGTQPGSHPFATNQATNAIAMPAVNLPAREMFFRTGQGLASFSLVGMQPSGSQPTETEAASDSQFFHRTLNKLRTYWPGEGDHGSATQGETGYLEPPTYALVS